MEYSRWASRNKDRLGINADAPDKKETLNMDNDARDAAIRGLIGKAKSNRGEQTDEEKQRANAVAVLAGKQLQKQQLRPGVSQLLGRDR